VADEWDSGTARTVLYAVATEAYNEQRWETAARLFYDAHNARGIRSRTAFIRSLRAARWGMGDERRWWRLVDERQTEFTEMAKRYERDGTFRRWIMS